MQRRPFPGFPGLAFLALMALVLAAGPLTRPVSSGMGLWLDAWRLSGVSLDAVCGAGGAGHRDGGCPLCTLAGPVGMACPTAFAIDAEHRVLARIVLPQLRGAAGHAHDPAVPKRGPPGLI